MYRKRKHLKQRLMAGAIVVLLVLTACAEPTPLASQAVALTSQDFAHAVNTLIAGPIATAFGMELWALRYDEEVERYFDNGYHTWHLSPFGGRA
ncbi:MAG: hypothetical protein Q8O76_02500, partial [Chloroflexota bacterium]|nr:hypothetical protein [Chloroflexota bacterium]